MAHAGIAAGPHPLRQVMRRAALWWLAASAATAGALACNGGSAPAAPVDAGPTAPSSAVDDAATAPPAPDDAGALDSTGAPPGGDPSALGSVGPNDLAALAVLLRDGKLKGYIHGAVHDRGLYVFTYRRPGDFFDFAEFPLTPSTDAVAAQLAAIKRHDAVAIQGSFINSIAPINHIRLDNLSVIASYRTDENPPPRTPETSFPADLEGKTEAIAKVHAIGSDGAMLVIEYGDAVVPVFVRVPALTAGLYRNDKIHLEFEYAPVPASPTHLWLNTAAAQPVEVLERLLDHHGKPFVADGALVRFPVSEQISVDVYAVQVVDADGITREYTLLNNDPTIFTAIAAKLAAAWKSRLGQAIDGRNKLVNPFIRVHASGTFNIVVPNQANAQIMLDSPDDVTVTFL